MAFYSFTSYWKVEAPLGKVALAIADVEHWPLWWPAVRRVDVLKHVRENGGVGSVYAHTWRSALPYDIHFAVEVTEVIPFQRLTGRSTGDLVGEGVWTLSHKNGLTTARYDWNVSTTKHWMNVVAPIGRPVFRWAHMWVMKRGELGLKKKLTRSAEQAQTKEQENGAK